MCRTHRIHREKALGDQRSDFEKDRDRILYSEYFKRLANVTQVIGPFEGYIFHNRLTHSLEVAQIARRIAENITKLYPNSSEFIDPNICEAVSLGHDLGHPPFGHIGENALNEMVIKAGNKDGFEGNAQTFRILTKLAINRPLIKGLNLSRAVLNGGLKYPWLKHEINQTRNKKFGAYRSELSDFQFARESILDDKKSFEAEIMDYADEVAYSVHDLSDFIRINLLPIGKLLNDEVFLLNL